MPFAFVACLIIVSIVMSLTSLVATGVLADVAATRTPLADGAAIFLGAGGARDDLDRRGHLDDRQQHGPAAEWLAHDFRAGRERRSAAVVRQVHPDNRTPSNAILFGAGVALVLALSGSFVALAAVSAIARLVMYLAVCLSTLVLRKRDREIAAQVGAHLPVRRSLGEGGTDPLQVVKPPTFTVPLGPVIPVLASLVALGILAGATQAHLIAGASALLGGAVLYAIAPKTDYSTR